MGGDRAAKIAMVLSGGIGVFLLLVFAGIFATTFHGVYAAQSWVETECQIVASRTKLYEDHDSDYWEALVTWRYAVGDTQHEHVDADPMVFSMALDEEEADAMVRRYPAGKTVTCFYDPEDPRTSKLDRSGPPWSAIAFAIVVALLLLATVVGGVVTFVVLRRRRR